MPRMRVPVVATVAACGAILCTASGALAFQGPWIAPVDLSAAGQAATGAELAVAPDGTTTATWLRFNGTHNIAQASTRPPGGTFSVPVDLSAPGANAGAREIATAPDGTTIVVWTRNDGAHNRIQASVRPPGGAFGGAVDLSAAGQNADLAQLAFAPDGTATVIWRRSDGSNNIAQVSTRPPGGSFSTPVDVSEPGESALSPVVAVAPDGTTTVGWRRSDGADTRVQVSTRPPGGTFSAPLTISAPGGSTGNLRLAAAPDGTTTAAWWRDSGGGIFIAQAVTRAPGGGFGATADLSAPGQSANNLQLVVGPDGTTTVVWQRSNGANPIVQASTRPPAGAFSPAIDLSLAGQNATNPRLGTGADGTTTVAWERSNGTNTIVQAVTRTPGGAFGATTDLSAAGQSAGGAEVAVAPDGSATVAWARSNGANTIVQASITANPPALRAAPAITGTAGLGAALSCDGGAWTGAATVNIAWLRGGTEVGTGSGYTTVAADQGTGLACRARATNPYGSVEALSTPFGIPAAVPAASPPNARSLPKITGRAKLGRKLRCRAATFTGSTKRTTAWLRGSKAISKATKSTYKITRKDIGRLITCRTKATGPGGTSTVISLAVRPTR